MVLSVVDGDEGYMATYAPQIATVQTFDSPEQAAAFNVGNHPAAEAAGKPYRSVVVPWDSWLEFEVFSESVRGTKRFSSYPSANPTLKRPS